MMHFFYITKDQNSTDPNSNAYRAGAERSSCIKHIDTTLVASRNQSSILDAVAGFL